MLEPKTGSDQDLYSPSIDLQIVATESHVPSTVADIINSTMVDTLHKTLAWHGNSYSGVQFIQSMANDSV